MKALLVTWTPRPPFLAMPGTGVLDPDHIGETFDLRCIDASRDTYSDREMVADLLAEEHDQGRTHIVLCGMRLRDAAAGLWDVRSNRLASSPIHAGLYVGWIRLADVESEAAERTRSWLLDLNNVT